MNTLNRTVIFGATSAIAACTVQQLVQNGASVFCVARDKEKLDILLADLKIRAAPEQIIAGITADLTDYSRHEALFSMAQESLGSLDSVLVAHGILPIQPDCENNIPLMLDSFHINALSVISLLSIAANLFTKKESGVIAAISSVAGDRGRQSNYVYGSAKGAVSIFMQGLRNRLTKKNISVVTIKPGFVRTPMTDGFERDGVLWADPEKIAKGIVNAMRKGKGEVYLPWFWQGIMWIIKSIPEFIFKRLSL